jgi:quercetin dioxygenase-like cupin family protein
MVRDYIESEIPRVYNLAEAPPAREEPGVKQMLFRGMDQMIGLTFIGAEASRSEPHTHPYEQLNMLIEGELRFIVDGEELTLTPYDTLMIPPHVPHTSEPSGDGTAVLLAFWPLREELAATTDYQSEFYG